MSEQISDREFIRKRWNETIKQLRTDYNKWENHTLKEYILKCDELAEQMIDNEILNIEKTDISSYLFKELIKEGIEVTDRYIQQVIPPEHKRNYSKSELASEVNESKWNILVDQPDLLVESDQFGDFRINGKEVYIKKETPSVEQNWDSSEQKQTKIINDKYTQFFHKIGIIGQLMDLMSDHMVNKYSEEPEIQDQIRDALPELEKLDIEITEYIAELRKLHKDADYRQRVSKFIKLKALLLERCKYSIAKVAKILAITPKHMSANIMKREKPEIENCLDWFEVFDIEAPRDMKKGDKLIINIKEWWNLQFERFELSLPFKKPLIEYVAK